MANEFKHKSVGTELTQAEFEGVDLHQFDSQATGDILYASSASQLSRLGIGSNGEVLLVSGGVPAWGNNPTLTSPTIQGTVSAGTGLTMPAFTLGGDLTLNGYVLDAGSGYLEVETTGGLKGIRVKSIQDSATGARLVLETVSTSPAANDRIGEILAVGRDSNGNVTDYGAIRFYIVDPTDGNEDMKFAIWGLNTGTWNEALRLSGAGALWLDRALHLDAESSKPTAGSDYRGWLLLQDGGASSPDKLYMCMKNSSDNYE